MIDIEAARRILEPHHDRLYTIVLRAWEDWDELFWAECDGHGIELDTFRQHRSSSRPGCRRTTTTSG